MDFTRLGDESATVKAGGVVKTCKDAIFDRRSWQLVVWNKKKFTSGLVRSNPSNEAQLPQGEYW